MGAQAFRVSGLVDAQAGSGELWSEFLRVPALSMGLYVLEAGAEDPQAPHLQDEVYYVVEGSSRLRVDAQDFEVAAGSILYVPAQAPHKFYSITERLVVLVFFAPAETPAPLPEAL